MLQQEPFTLIGDHPGIRSEEAGAEGFRDPKPECVSDRGDSAILSGLCPNGLWRATALGTSEEEAHLGHPRQRGQTWTVRLILSYTSSALGSCKATFREKPSRHGTARTRGTLHDTSMNPVSAVAHTVASTVPSDRCERRHLSPIGGRAVGLGRWSDWPVPQRRPVAGRQTGGALRAFDLSVCSSSDLAVSPASVASPFGVGLRVLGA